MMQVERNWLNPDGIPGRPWFKHILYGARFTYAHLELPGLAEAAREAGLAHREAAGGNPAARTREKYRTAESPGRESHRKVTTRSVLGTYFSFISRSITLRNARLIRV